VGVIHPLPQSFLNAWNGESKMLKPSKRHFILYDAQTYEKTGLTQVNGNVRAMAQKPQLWRVSVNPVTTDGILIDKTRLVFAPKERLKLSELAPIINEHIHSIDDFLDKCISVIVCARVMTEGGL
jgi:hypothetical protein